MKKIFSLICILAFAYNAFAQEEKTELVKPMSPSVAALQTGAALAQYGYDNFSATSLIEAARILGTTET